MHIPKSELQARILGLPPCGIGKEKNNKMTLKRTKKTISRNKLLDRVATYVKEMSPKGINGLCPCGSGLKYKRCHLPKLLDPTSDARALLDELGASKSYKKYTLL